jgi:hypothetical protein
VRLEDSKLSEEPDVSIFMVAAILLPWSWRHITFSLQKLKGVKFNEFMPMLIPVTGHYYYYYYYYYYY